MKVDLLQMVEYGGCSSKVSPKLLEEILKYLPLPKDPNILVDIDTHDDAGVYRVNKKLALVLTTDFFPPVCSDPYEFGQIAAANSISDVYAMGGDPVLALNIMMFPAAKLPMEAYTNILKGGFDKAAEAGVRIIGGHTFDDFPPKYGLAVVGYIHPDKIITNAGAVPGEYRGGVSGEGHVKRRAGARWSCHNHRNGGFLSSGEAGRIEGDQRVDLRGRDIREWRGLARDGHRDVVELKRKRNGRRAHRSRSKLGTEDCHIGPRGDVGGVRCGVHDGQDGLPVANGRKRQEEDEDYHSSHASDLNIIKMAGPRSRRRNPHRLSWGDAQIGPAWHQSAAGAPGTRWPGRTA